MKKPMIIFGCLVTFVSLLLINGLNQSAHSLEPQQNIMMEEPIHRNKLSEKEKAALEKELEEFLDKEIKPNILLPLPDPNDDRVFKGMPLPDEDHPEVKKLN